MHKQHSSRATERERQQCDLHKQFVAISCLPVRQHLCELQQHQCGHGAIHERHARSLQRHKLDPNGFRHAFHFNADRERFGEPAIHQPADDLQHAFFELPGLVLSSNSNLLVNVGEGATPTWETTAHYTMSSIGTESSAAFEDSSTTSSDLTHVNIGTAKATTVVQMKMYIDNVASSTIFKDVSITFAGIDTGGPLFAGHVWGFWNLDKNPITALEVLPDAGNLTSGTCSLYGMN
jgi:hypothetical protein